MPSTDFVVSESLQPDAKHATTIHTKFVTMPNSVFGVLLDRIVVTGENVVKNLNRCTGFQIKNDIEVQGQSQNHLPRIRSGEIR